MPPFKIMSFWALISVNCIDLGSPGRVLLRKCSSWYYGVVRREGNSQKRKASPCKTVCFTSCLHILALHVLIDSPLELSPFRCLPASLLTLSPQCCCLVKLPCDKFLSLLFVAEKCFHRHLWMRTVLPASLLALASCCCCCMKLLADKVLRYQQAPNLENYQVNFSDALAMPKRYPRDTPLFLPRAHQSVTHSCFLVAS